MKIKFKSDESSWEVKNESLRGEIGKSEQVDTRSREVRPTPTVYEKKREGIEISRRAYEVPQSERDVAR